MDIFQAMNQFQRNPQIFQSNPLFNRAIQMGQGKNEDELKVIIRNLADQRGVSVDQLNMFLTPMGLKL